VKRATTLVKVLGIIADESVKNRQNLRIGRRQAETKFRGVQVEKHVPRLSRIHSQVLVPSQDKRKVTAGVRESANSGDFIWLNIPV